MFITIGNAHQTTIIYHFTSSRKLKSKSQIITNVGEDVEKLEPLTAGGNVKWCSHFGKQPGNSSKGKHRITIWPISSTSRYVDKRTENISTRKICTLMLKVALFITDKRWEKNKWPSTDKRRNKTWRIWR